MIQRLCDIIAPASSSDAIQSGELNGRVCLLGSMSVVAAKLQNKSFYGGVVSFLSTFMRIVINSLEGL